MPNRILVVDDNEESRELLGELLQGLGHDVHLAQHGKEALSILPRLPGPCTVLLDLNMPEMGGELVLRTLAEGSLGAFPVIVISADDRPIETAYPNIVGRLFKPFELAVLREALARASSTDSGGG